MMRPALLTILMLFLPLLAPGRQQDRSGTVTYLSGNVVYTSLGKTDGVTDSTRLFVMSGTDTAATLVVFAVSSTSSACRVDREKRRPAVGDRVIAPVPSGETKATPKEVVPAPVQSAAVRPDSLRALSPDRVSPPVNLNGRIGLQYFTTRYSSAASKIVQPGISVNIQGTARDMPVRFELYGNVRGLALGTQNPFSGSLTNQTRIYRMSLAYNDGENRISIGRIIPLPSPSIGYVDGILLARSTGRFTFGAVGGFEPDFVQRSVSTDLRKYAFFAGYQTTEPFRILTSISYARTYFHSLLNREVLSGSASVSAGSATFFSAQSDVDLRTKVNQSFALKPKLTSLYAALNHRLTDIVTLSLGVNAWRPFYPFSSVLAIPDSMLDRRIQASPSAGVSLYLSPGLSFSTTYSPRTSDQGFGKEYTEYSTFGISNLLGQGISAYGNVNWNASGLSRTVGYGTSVQKTISELAAVTLRFQTYRYTLLPLETSSTSQSIAADLMISLTRSLMLWGSVERLVGLGADGYTGLGELSWRF